MKYWTTKNGTKIKVSEMTTSHINNCINMLEKHLANKPEYMIYMGNGDMAELAVDAENKHNDMVAEEVEKTIDAFRQELVKREAEVARARQYIASEQ